MTIHIKALTFEAIIGILQHERERPQEVVIDCTIEYHFVDGDFLDYACIVSDIQERVIQKRYYLIEEALEDLENYFIQHYKEKIQSLFIEIKKPDIFDNCTVSISQKRKF